MNLSTPQVVAVCLSEGGIPRFPVGSAQLTLAGLQGDGHRFAEHFAPERAVTLFDQELLDQFAPREAPFPPGSVGENITVAGVDLVRLEVGFRLQIGQAEICLTRRWKPCHARSAESGVMAANDQDWTGFFARVVSPGEITPGMAIEVIQPDG